MPLFPTFAILRMQRLFSIFASLCGFLAVIAIILNLNARLDVALSQQSTEKVRQAKDSTNDGVGLLFEQQHQHTLVKNITFQSGSWSLDDAINTSEAMLLDPPTGVAGTLRRRALWENRSAAGLELTPLAREVEQHQTNCALPVGIFEVDNEYGLGSHLHQWSQVVCNGMETGHRIRTHNYEWLWLDQAYCPSQQYYLENSTSLFDCYFPSAEPRCPVDDTPEVVEEMVPNTYDAHFVWCERVLKNDTFRSEWRAASMEYMFRQVSPLVLREAQRQVGLLFPGGIVPENLITVHIRWGDKHGEMDLVPIRQYMRAVRRLIKFGNNNDSQNTTSDDVNIYLATEDPRAIRQFVRAAPKTWNIYGDRTVTELSAFRPQRGNHASSVTLKTKGRGGLVALGSLLVALEANKFVLTTGSNWSRLMNELRKNVLDRACNHCTRMVDLMPGEY